MGCRGGVLGKRHELYLAGFKINYIITNTRTGSIDQSQPSSARPTVGENLRSPPSSLLQRPLLLVVGRQTKKIAMVRKAKRTGSGGHERRKKGMVHHMLYRVFAYHVGTAARDAQSGENLLGHPQLVWFVRSCVAFFVRCVSVG